MRYGFTKDGSFVVVDDEHRVGSFAFPTSANAESAKRNPEATAEAMLDSVWTNVPPTSANSIT